MSLRSKPSHGIPYWVFTAGRNREIHLGPVNNPSKINIDKVYEALNYTKTRFSHYTDVEDKLIHLLPESDRVPYISKRLIEMKDYASKLILLLPEDKRTQYLQQKERLRHLNAESPELFPKELVEGFKQVMKHNTELVEAKEAHVRLKQEMKKRKTTEENESLTTIEQRIPKVKRFLTAVGPDLGEPVLKALSYYVAEQIGDNATHQDVIRAIKVVLPDYVDVLKKNAMEKGITYEYVGHP